jgi:ABC-2 type transport system ATP-binding protein
MIEIKNVSKNFNGLLAVNDVSVTMQEGLIFGLVGTNGAGKSTLLRMIAGILKPDCGEIFIDEMPVYENPQAKAEMFYISDDQHFFNNGTPMDMMKFYSVCYPKFDKKLFVEMLDKFGLEKNRKIRTFSKGMKKQVSVICGICANTKYLLCDETFDGLDPMMRQAVKSIFAAELSRRQMTPIIASHNMRELEDICDHVGLLHQGGVLFSKDLEDMKYNIQKIQVVFQKEEDKSLAFEGLEILQEDKRGTLYTVTARGSRAKILKQVESVSPVFCEVLPLSLEEIFISETEVAGYDIRKIIF